MTTRDAVRHGRSQSTVVGTDLLAKAVVRERALQPRSDVLVEGEVPQTAHMLLEGHTYRYRLLTDGRRQITSILVPGDICDLEAVIRRRADYSVGALTHCVVGEIPLEQIRDAVSFGSDLSWPLWRQVLRDEAISREWLVSMGRRDALERVACLLCELRVRLEVVGLGDATGFEMRITQVELADIFGLSAVHVNRTLQQLRRSELIEMSNSRVTILDLATLELVAGFDPSYLKMH